MWNYTQIKGTAKLLGRRVTDLLALAPQNDPFYVGTPTDIAQGQWFAATWRRAGYTAGVHLRRIHYWIVSQDPPVPMHAGGPYQNTDRCWKYLCQASKMARYLGLVQIADIADKKNPDPHVHAAFTNEEPNYHVLAPDIDQPYVAISGIEIDAAQPYLLELWIEKSTMDDVLLPVAQQYRANLVTFEGEASITACYALVQRIEQAGRKPTRIWYIADFDPAGKSMPVATARKVEYLLNVFNSDFDVRIASLALSLEQVQDYRLPRTPIKPSERRAANFEEAFGSGAVELDALEAIHPGALARLVEEAIAPYYSQTAARAVIRAREELRQTVNRRIAEITGHYRDEIEALQTMTDALRAVEAEFDPAAFAVDRFAPHVTEEDEVWLFDSSRTYLAQIDHYKAHRGL